MNRRLTPILAILALLGGPARSPSASDVIDPARGTAQPGDPGRWYDIRLLGVEGRGWDESKMKSPFDRLPARAEGLVRDPVWQLGRQSAGLCVRFVTDAPTIRARWTLTSDRLAMPHMPATGVSGLDLYARLDGRWRWLGVGQPQRSPTNTATLAAGLPPASREYLLYLPLYNGVSSVEIGLPEGRPLAKGPPRAGRDERPIVVYGTSITQGGCASRPGMAHSAILGRRLERPVINLGFSGNGKMEPEMAGLLAELDPAVYVLDCLPNMNAGEVEARVEPFVRALREAHPTTPILLAEDRTYANAPLLASPRERNASDRAALRKAHDRLVAAGIGGLSYLPGDVQLGDDGEATVDGSHPTDLGFVRMADAFEAALRPILAADPVRGRAGTTTRSVPAPLASAFRPPDDLRGDLGAYRSPLIFDDGRPVRDPAEWPLRRREILATWDGILGARPAPIERPGFETLGTERRESFEQRRVRVEIHRGRTADGYLLVPDGPGPFPAVLVVFYEPETAIGRGKPGRDFALQLARRGFVALAIGLDPYTLDPSRSGIATQPLSYLAHVASNCYNALAALAVVDRDRIGVLGHSYGGKWAMFASCLDDRFACGVWSDPGIVFDEARPNVNYWEPWYLGWEPGRSRERGVITAERPRLGAYRRLVDENHDLHELHALMAPRPFLVSGGSEDQAGRWKALNHAVAVNRLLGLEDRVAMTNRPGHDPTPESNEQILLFLEHFLKPPGRAGGA